MDGGAWRATVHGVAKSWTQLNNFHLAFPGELTEQLERYLKRV